MPRRWRYEVILVGTGAAATSHDLLDGLSQPSRHHLLHGDSSSGRAACLNTAAKAARAPVFCLLDPGATLMRGWLEPMHRLLGLEKTAGCIGNIHREPYSGLIDHAGIFFRADGFPASNAQNAALPPSMPYTRHAAVSAACCLMKRTLFERLGGFDERFQQRFDDVDFCLRAAEAGFRHFVANRSGVYHHADTEPPGEADLALYLSRWGARARAYHLEKIARLAQPLFSPERWEMARESRRQRRQDVRDVRKDGRRYLGKHLLRPWRYNYGRVCQALVQTVHPVPAAVPRPPAFLSDDGAGRTDFAVQGDAALFDPPRR